MENNLVLQTIRERASIRAYKDMPLTPAQLQALQTAALCAPTAMNRQAQRFLFITNRELIADVERSVFKALTAKGDEAALRHMASRDNKVIYDAPLFVVVAADENNSSANTDAGIACQTLALAAQSMGLHSVILGNPSLAFEVDCSLAVRAKMPKGYRYALGIAIGHGAIQKAPHEIDETHIITVE